MQKVQNINHKSQEWTGKLGFILSLVGAAVGLGNIWRFPYLLSTGGGVFILLYALSMFILVLPIMFFEIRMGQIIRRNPIDAFSHLCKKYHTPQAFKLNAYLGLFIVFCVLTFYTVVSGWVIYYLILSTTAPPAIDFESSTSQWTSLLGSHYKMIFFNTIFLLCNFLVLTRGVKRGLEMLNRLMLPGLVGILVFMLIFASFSKEMDIGKAFRLLFSIKSEHFNTHVMISALGQALFTLAVGACAILTYGAYLPKGNNKIAFSSNVIIITQLAISIVLGLVVYSLLLNNSKIGDFTDVAGPKLIFVVLPVFFAKTALPQTLTVLFFIVAFLAAITSSVNIAEPMVYTLINKYKIKRAKACALIMSCIFITSSILSLSFRLEQDIFGTIVDFTTEFTMPLAAFIFSVLAGWFVDKTLLKEMVAKEDLQSNSQNLNKVLFYKFARFSMRYLFPTALALVVFF